MGKTLAKHEWIICLGKYDTKYLLGSSSILSDKERLSTKKKSTGNVQWTQHHLSNQTAVSLLTVCSKIFALGFLGYFVLKDCDCFTSVVVGRCLFEMVLTNRFQLLSKMLLYFVCMGLLC